ncbi:hypothetical protein [Bradyrhizobium sp. AZCC 2230]|uniref:hypothetical protein n=1 Tax=Bradyrhizobium sp. AZCC 2230 TaxID=3117021 RepID=UPI0030499AC4
MDYIITTPGFRLSVRTGFTRHFVALSTYLGHADIRNTYWYLQATPEMMADIASAAEMLVGGSVL